MVKKILLCRPDFFDVTYAINPWMKVGSVNKALALKQWSLMEESIRSWGVDINLIDQYRNLPDMVFTANAGAVYGDKVVLSNFKHNERKDETYIFKSFFDYELYDTYLLPDNLSFEGCGDTAVVGRTMYAGYGFRSDLSALKLASEILDLDLVFLRLINPNFYHLDTCLCFLREDLAIFYPGAFSKYTVRKLKNIELIPVSEFNANNFACNSIVYGNNILMPSGNENLNKMLSGYGFNVTFLDTSEFLKSGGSLQCMSLWI